jgi:hypothetical protein
MRLWRTGKCAPRFVRLLKIGRIKEGTPKVGDAFNSISTLLRGPGEEGRGKIDRTSRTKTVEAALDFAEASQRFQSRAP